MGFLIYIIIACLYIAFKIIWEVAELMIKTVIFLVTACFGRATWVRF
jgi:hypothetical protein